MFRHVKREQKSCHQELGEINQNGLILRSVSQAIATTVTSQENPDLSVLTLGQQMGMRAASALADKSWIKCDRDIPEASGNIYQSRKGFSLDMLFDSKNPSFCSRRWVLGWLGLQTLWETNRHTLDFKSAGWLSCTSNKELPLWPRCSKTLVRSPVSPMWLFSPNTHQELSSRCVSS